MGSRFSSLHSQSLSRIGFNLLLLYQLIKQACRINRTSVTRLILELENNMLFELVGMVCIRIIKGNHMKISKLNTINGTTALNMFALSKGAKILRVHDVKQAMECIYLNEEINCN